MCGVYTEMRKILGTILEFCPTHRHTPPLLDLGLLIPVLWPQGSPCVVPRPMASASRQLVRHANEQSYSRLNQRLQVGVDLNSLCFNKSSGYVWGSLKFENQPFRPGSAKSWCQMANSDLMTVLINKVLLVHTYTPLFSYDRGPPSHDGGGIAGQTPWLTEPKIFITWPFPKTKFAYLYWGSRLLDCSRRIQF